MLKIVSLFSFFLFYGQLFAQLKQHYALNWKKFTNPETKSVIIGFDGANFEDREGILPFFKAQFNKGIAKVVVENEVYEDLSSEEILFFKDKKISTKIDAELTKSYRKKQPVGIVSFCPVIKVNNSQYKKLVSFDLSVELSESNINKRSGLWSYASSSVLSSGTWYKLGVVNEGIYKLSYDQLLSFGISIESVDPRNIRIYGNGGGALAYSNLKVKPDDLIECAIKIVGEEDGSFDQQDYILFYGQSQTRWKYDGITYNRKKNIFTDTTYYFLQIDGANGKRISQQSSSPTATQTVNGFDDYSYYENDRINLIRSGNRWFGEAFEITTSQDFNFTFKNIDNAAPITVRTQFAAASVGTSSSYTVSAGTTSQTNSVKYISGGYDAAQADDQSGELSAVVSASNFNVNITFNKANNSANGWLDYIEVVGRRKLIYNNEAMFFRDSKSLATNAVNDYNVLNASVNELVWDVTDHNDCYALSVNQISGGISFIQEAKELREFVVFNQVNSPSPYFKGKILNQDLHQKATLFPDYIIVTHPLFLTQAKELADFHESQDGLTSLVVTTNEVYNEFSSGAQDITAIKDFIKMFYDQAGTDTSKLPKYLLLFGDASYDYKNIREGNTNFIPVYQSYNSFEPTGSYATDDYYGLLDDSEGDNVNDLIDIAIGRFPVQTAEQARNMVQKVKAYYEPTTYGSWRNWLTFVGDDEDNNIHMSQADEMASKAKANNPFFNVDKIYLDAYPEQAGAGGNRYPDVSKAISDRVLKGSLLVTYVGHGGELGWAHERVLENSQINSWNNINNMPLFLTATCEFSRFDDPDRTSAGENVLLNKNGGGIGLLTTTRLVFSHLNRDLMVSFYDKAFSKMNDELSTIGDLVYLTKQYGPLSVNTRNFSLLGDPAVRLAYPQYNVMTTSRPDTIKALSRVTIKGKVTNKNNVVLNDYNGIVYPTVFDKEKSMSTLNNDGVGVFTYGLQKNIIFKGKASVVNGEFQFSFVTPKDIDFKYGSGRISYYAENGVSDAAGFDTTAYVGGFDENASSDTQGPDIKLYMNDDSFVFGGVTDETPVLIAELYDENGINTTGNGVGHDIVGVLDENTVESIALNDFYESNLDDYTKGKITYQLSTLEEGNHKIKLKAWDVYNNSGEGYTEFIVAKTADLALEHVLNYPNPFTTKTSFYFEHNQPGQNLDVTIQIFTVSGKLIKTINIHEIGTNSRIGPIDWDGKDDFGDNIGKGVYVYKVSVRNDNGQQVDKYEKLVLLK